MIRRIRLWNPMRPPAPDQVTVDEPYAEQLLRALEEAGRYNAWIAGCARAHLLDPVLELGCGNGNLTVHLAGSFPRIFCADFSEGNLARLAERCGGHPSVTILHGDVMEPVFRERLRVLGARSILAVNVLEHIREDGELVSFCRAILPAGGRLVVMVPAFRSLYSDIDRRVGHFRRYTASEVRDLLTGAGFAIRDVRYVNSLGWLAWWARKLTGTMGPVTRGEVLTFDGAIIPVMRALENLGRPPFGMTVLAAGERCA